MNATEQCSLLGDWEPSHLDNSSPKVTIGLPVYNGENFIEEAIESILAQTFEDYELIISDNASTDKTAAICQRYTDQDPRVRYYRSAINRGPAWNYNRVFELARGEYFKWAAHDDVLTPYFIEKALARLEHNPAAVLSFSQVEVIDETSERIDSYDVQLATDSASPVRRFQEMMSLKHRCYDIFGLMRTDMLAQTPLIGAYAGSDRVLLSQLSLQGPFEVIPEPLFQARQHSQQSIAMLRSPRHKLLRMHDYAIWFDPKNKGRLLLPNWRIFYEYFSAVKSVSLKKADKFQCYRSLLSWLISYHNWAKLLRDLFIVAIQILWRGQAKLFPGHHATDSKKQICALQEGSTATVTILLLAKQDVEERQTELSEARTVAIPRSKKTRIRNSGFSV